MTTRQTLALLRAYESRNVTFVEPDGSWPIVWDRAKGVHVWDAEGKEYLDLTAAFGVAADGSCEPACGQGRPETNGKAAPRHGRRAPSRAQSPARARVEPAYVRTRGDAKKPEQSSAASSRWTGNLQSIRERALAPAATGKTIFCNSGFEAVEAALKTALLATGKPGVIAFEGAYHGLGYGALNATHREHFRSPFRSQLRQFGHFAPFPKAGQASRLSSPSPNASSRDRRDACPTLETVESRLRGIFRREKIGAVLVEPIQARGGINIPPPQFLPLLRRLCDEHNALLVLDEIYTGLGRTGKWFACEHSAVVPDIICLGKALTGGFPLSACVGSARMMDSAWPPSSGEAIHTSTFLGHPVGCAMALAQIEEIKTHKLVQRSAELGQLLLASLSTLNPQPSTLNPSARGLGLLAGLELRLHNGKPATQTALRALKAMLHRGFILLPEGEHSNVLSFTPPYTISAAQLQGQ